MDKSAIGCFFVSCVGGTLLLTFLLFVTARNTRAQIYGTLLENSSGVLESLRESFHSLAHSHRTHILLLMRYRYGSWTQNFPRGAAHPCRAPHPAGVATGHDHHLGGACPTG